MAEIGAIADRVRLLHMKDRAAGPGAARRAGRGGDAAVPGDRRGGRAAGVEWYIVEQDEPAEPLADVATSLRYLESLAV